MFFYRRNRFILLVCAFCFLCFSQLQASGSQGDCGSMFKDSQDERDFLLELAFGMPPEPRRKASRMKMRSQSLELNTTSSDLVPQLHVLEPNEREQRRRGLIFEVKRYARALKNLRHIKISQDT